MSRTYRRKNSIWSMKTYNWNWSGGSCFVVNYEPDSQQYAKIKMDFHRESRRSGHSVPSWFVTVYCEKKFRANTKKEIYNWIKNPDNYECMLPEFIRDAAWMYF